ncbi:MAG TPA: GerMN domain-containing protein [Acidimicrobiales bacterium]|nr:GerMN domain-containing protein [Acidimicrobiales bacterium]
MRRAVVPLAVLAALALSSCTLVSPNATPSRIPSKSVPFGLLDPTIPGTNHARVRFITQPVYIVDASGHLAPSSRIVPSPPALATVVEQLLLGPTPIEVSAGYTSALPKTLVVISANVVNNIGYINFATSLSSLARAQQLLAIGQLVLTADVVGATKGLEIRVAGTPQELLLPNGKRTKLATPNDFQSLLNA